MLICRRVYPTCRGGGGFPQKALALIVLGIDPGTATTGYGVVLVDEGNNLKALDYGCIRTPSGLPDELRLKRLYTGVEELIEGRLTGFKPSVLAIERLFFNKNSRTALAVGQARGVVLLAAANAGLEVAEYTPLEVKMAVSGYGRADKRQIQAMVRTLLRLEQTPQPDDAADALAVAICCCHSIKKIHPEEVGK